MNQKQAKRIRQALRRVEVNANDKDYYGGYFDGETTSTRTLKPTCGRRVYRAAKNAARNS